MLGNLGIFGTGHVGYLNAGHRWDALRQRKNACGSRDYCKLKASVVEDVIIILELVH